MALQCVLRDRLQRTSANGEKGVVLKFRTFPEGVVCESSDVRKLKLEIIIYRDSNMRAFTYDVCSNLGVSK